MLLYIINRIIGLNTCFFIRFAIVFSEIYLDYHRVLASP